MALSQQTLLNASIPAADNIPLSAISTHYSSIISNGKGGLWFGNNGFGITELQDGHVTPLKRSNCGAIKDQFINTLYRSRRGIIFVGEKMHLNYMLPSGKSFTCLEGVDIRGITEDH